jgi:hypothetical protein|tara:strand:- start:109 stop:243 length:135 start_codon:yes stop_codon:yes gene_type:complete
MNDDESKKYYESEEANQDSKSDANVILILIVIGVIAMTYWASIQ